MKRWPAFAFAGITLLLSSFRPTPTPGLVWWTTHALEKIVPAQHQPESAARGVKISAARNEFEPFQVVLRAEDRDISGLDIEVTDLRGPNSVIPANKYVTVYLERYVYLSKPSSATGGTGEWPDPLIPRVDRYENEKRNAFPVNLVAGRTQPFWVDVYVPPSAAPGSYHGEIRVTTGGKPEVSIPLDLQVWDFQLPSTSSLITTFGFSGNTAVHAHFGKYTKDREIYELTSLYEKAALWHRISLDGSAAVMPGVSVQDGHVNLRWDLYDATVGPFLNGTVFSADQPLQGAKATSVTLHTPPSLSSSERQVEFWRQSAKHFREKGWFDRMFNYLWDEPKTNDFPAMIQMGKLVRSADPNVKNLVTAPLHPAWSDVIDIWTPLINCFERKPNHEDFCDPNANRSAYDGELAKGKQLWWYQSCGSHGCFIVGGDYFRGWPSYTIDDSPVANRIMEWMSWKYGIHGELYFNMDEGYGKNSDPWKEVNLFGGNGDGTLFYPGRPDMVGGATNIPIESIRLKLIREGLEDYEYLAMLTNLLGRNAVADHLNAFIRSAYDFDRDPSKLYSVREWMGNEISKLSASR